MSDSSMSKKSLLSNRNMNELKKMISADDRGSFSNRLSSLRIPKDLSLGGTKLKKFTPNINFARNSNEQRKSSPSPFTTHSSKKSTNEHRHKNNHFKGAKRHGGKFENNSAKHIRVEGAFSLGLGNNVKPLISKTIERNYSLRVPTKNTSKFVATIPSLNEEYDDSTDERTILNDMFPCVGSEDEDKDDLFAIDSKSAIKKEPFNLEELAENLNGADMVKKEDESTCMLYDKYKRESQQIELKTKIKKEIKTDLDFQYLKEPCFTNKVKYDEENPSFSLITLPGNFIGFPKKEDNFHYNLKDLPPGQIGKLVIRQSGKVEMIFKNFKADVQVLENDRKQEVVVTMPGEESISIEPSIVELGKISSSFILTPSWKDIHNKIKENNR